MGDWLNFISHYVWVAADHFGNKDGVPTLQEIRDFECWIDQKGTKKGVLDYSEIAVLTQAFRAIANQEALLPSGFEFLESYREPRRKMIRRDVFENSEHKKSGGTLDDFEIIYGALEVSALDEFLSKFADKYPDYQYDKFICPEYQKAEVSPTTQADSFLGL